MYFSQKVLLSGLQISSIITVQVRTTTYTSCFVARWTFSKSCSTRLSPPARPLSPSVSVFPFLCLLSRCEERSNIPSNHIQSLCFFFHPVALRHHKAFKQGQSCGGGGRVEGILSCLLRSIFTIFCALSSLYPDLSERHHSRRLAPPDPLLCLPLSVCSNRGPDNNSARCRIVYYWKPPRLHKQLTHLVVFFWLLLFCFVFWAHTRPPFWSAFYRPLLCVLRKRFCGTKTTSWDKRGQQQGF